MIRASPSSRSMLVTRSGAASSAPLRRAAAASAAIPSAARTVPPLAWCSACSPGASRSSGNADASPAASSRRGRDALGRHPLGEMVEQVGGPQVDLAGEVQDRPPRLGLERPPRVDRVPGEADVGRLGVRRADRPRGAGRRRQRVARAERVERDDAPAAARERQRGRQADQALADDHDVVVIRSVTHPRTIPHPPPWGLQWGQTPIVWASRLCAEVGTGRDRHVTGCGRMVGAAPLHGRPPTAGAADRGLQPSRVRTYPAGGAHRRHDPARCGTTARR